MKRKLVNSSSFTFPSKSVNEAFARMSVAAMAIQLDPTIEELADIKTAVSEAVTNCIVHAYRDYVGTIKIAVKYFDDGLLRIYIKDTGCGIGDIGRAMEPLYTSDGSGERSGMGFTIMQSFMDKCRVSSKDGKGTSVVLEKLIGKAKTSDRANG